MYIAKLGHHVIEPGTDITIEGIEDFSFKVLKVLKTGFTIEWSVGENKGQKDTIPFSMFKGIGQEIELVEVSNSTTDPNAAFLHRRLSNGN